MTTDNAETPETPEETLEQLGADLETPEAIEKYDAAVAATLGDETPPESPGAQASEASSEGTPPPPPTPETPAAPQVPEYWASVKPEDKPAIVDAMLRGLSPEERGKITSLNEVLGATARDAQARGAMSADEQRQATERAQARVEGVKGLRDLMRQYVPANTPGIEDKIKDIDNLAQFAESHVGELQNVIGWFYANKLGVSRPDQIPDAVVKAAEAAASPAEAMGVHLNYFMQAAYNSGRSQSSKTDETKAAAERAVLETRIKNEHEADLIKQGWISPTPPAISGSVPASGGLTPDGYRDRLARGEDLSEAEIDAMTQRLLATAR